MNKKIISLQANTINRSLVGQGNLGRSDLTIISLAPQAGADLSSQLHGLFEQLAKFLQEENMLPNNVIKHSFFVSNLEQASLIKAEINKFYEGCPPAYSIIPQPPANGEKCLMEVIASPVCPQRINPFLSVVSSDDIDWGFVAGIQPGGPEAGRFNCTKETLLKMQDLFNRNKFDFKSVARAWFYQHALLEFSNDGRQNYQCFNDARAEFYKALSFNVGNSEYKYGRIPPAATGIGMSDGSILFEAIAVKSSRSDVRGIPVKNPFQTNPYEYEQEVLAAGVNMKKSPPSFSRGYTVTDSQNTETLFVSGTASVEGSKVIYKSDVLAQTRLAIKNVSRVLAQRNMSLEHLFLARAYVARPVHYTDSDFEKAVLLSHDVVRELIPATPCLFVQANVCRPEWLFEIEGIAGRR